MGRIRHSDIQSLRRTTLKVKTSAASDGSRNVGDDLVVVRVYLLDDAYKPCVPARQNALAIRIEPDVVDAQNNLKGGNDFASVAVNYPEFPRLESCREQAAARFVKGQRVVRRPTLDLPFRHCAGLAIDDTDGFLIRKVYENS